MELITELCNTELCDELCKIHNYVNYVKYVTNYVKYGCLTITSS